MKNKLHKLFLQFFDRLCGYCVHGYGYGKGCMYCEDDGHTWMKNKHD